MEVDLHIHSLHSDGVLTADEILQLADERKIQQLSITDHDTVSAYDVIPEEHPARSKLIVGCEFSTVWRSRTIHVVGLNLNLKSAALEKAMRIQEIAREKRAESIAAVLEKQGFAGALTGAKDHAKNSSCIGRPHFAKFLEAEGHVKDQKQAFKKYLGAGKPGDIKAQWRELSEVIGWILDSGGVPVLAHPLKYGMTQTKLRELVYEFKSHGGLAIEVVSGSQQKSQTDQLAKLADDFELYASAGSDFHRPGQKWAELGSVAELPVVCRPVWQLWN